MTQPASNLRCSFLGTEHQEANVTSPQRARRKRRQSAARAAPAARVLVFADDAERAAALKCTFERLGHTVHVSVHVRDRRRLLRHHPPGIAVVSTERRSAATERAVTEIANDGAVRVIMIITRDSAQRTVVDLLRRGPRGYVRTSSLTLPDDAFDHSVWTWIATLASTLAFESGARRRQHPTQ